MTQGFFQFNTSIINEIVNFTTSPFDLFFLSGPKGSSKSETIEKIIPELQDEFLIFRHFCFENSVIDDFLLNFYDELRNFSLAGKLSLKKFTTGDFKEKVTHYFKTINENCIIIVENFEKVESNTEIIDFLVHLSRFLNVKLIIVSRNPNNIFNDIRTRTYNIEQITKEDFKSKLTILTQPLDDEIKENFYKITQGLELYLNMSVKYCSNTGVLITDLMAEFERRDDNFEHFIISKFISLTPSNYREFFRILSVLSHPVSLEFIKAYNLGDTGFIDYLSNNFLISRFDNEIYVKDYFKKYIREDLTVQDKYIYYTKLSKIYENELTKSPKDRLLRLSRESIRKEIELFNSQIPKFNSQSQKPFSYIGMSSFDFGDEKTKEKADLSDKLKKIKERKNKLTKKEEEILIEKRLEEAGNISLVNENREKNRMFIVDLINDARELSLNYHYKEANDNLLRAVGIDFDNEFKIELYILIAKNLEALNEYQQAQDYYMSALDLAVQRHDIRTCEIQCLSAQLSKKQFRIDVAKEKFLQIAANDVYSDKYRAIASIELGEIEESQGNIEPAAKNYQNALALSLGSNKNLAAKSYYRLAILYDENEDIEKAIEYYKKNYTLSGEHSENPYYSISLTNLASIYMEQGNYQEAGEFLKLALSYDTENNDLENMYYSQKELAKLYSKTGSDSAVGYYKQALDSANKLNDTFKVALVYFEAGEYYYDRGEDERALESFFNAKKVLGSNSKDENISRINSRIQDIKMRLNSTGFNIIASKYDEL